MQFLIQKKTLFSSVLSNKLAERGGFEPPDRINRSTDFESAAFDHSATSPFLFPFYINPAACQSESIIRTSFYPKILSLQVAAGAVSLADRTP